MYIRCLVRNVIPNELLQEMEAEDADDGKDKMDVDDKQSDSHLDEVLFFF